MKSFPSFERYELGSQLRKAAYSVAANIAEGYGRRHQRIDYVFSISQKRRSPKSPIAFMPRGASDYVRDRQLADSNRVSTVSARRSPVSFARYGIHRRQI